MWSGNYNKLLKVEFFKMSLSKLSYNKSKGLCDPRYCKSNCNSKAITYNLKKSLNDQYFGLKTVTKMILFMQKHHVKYQMNGIIAIKMIVLDIS